ncbi:OLC1v1039170C1 [Oldenlandia corymbosa var. corymbosa]|uniref:OLC1v1039170C1 n=1 Tax=Oldenlandia corymbosa var. corymbosa TaxID=529605 RepID=A0AAV1D2K6_OLDCO|nr:OLC1v1039170C1 [Oldenlandia corymbosa var. corymbosa]
MTAMIKEQTFRSSSQKNLIILSSSKSSFLAPTMAEAKRYAVVTGANKGIGFEVCRELASHGITVVMTARDEKRGLDALGKLKSSNGFSDDILFFHQLDVADSSSVASLAEFIKNQFGRLDILVNNAGVSGVHVDADVEAIKAEVGESEEARWDAVTKAMTQTYESALECLEINYYGAKRMVEAFIPLLQLSQSPTIVNVSSEAVKLLNLSEWAIRILNDVDNLTEERIDEVLNAFLKDFKEGTLEANGWPVLLSGYRVSKVAINAYTRLLAKKYRNIKVNCVCPGHGKTDSSFNIGTYTAEECARNVVMVALLPDDGPSGLFFVRGKVSSF